MRKPARIEVTASQAETQSERRRVGDDEQTLRLQHPRGLDQGTIRVGDVLQRRDERDDVEPPVRERQVFGPRLDDLMSRGARHRDEFVRRLDPDGVAVRERLPHRAEHAPVGRAHVEQGERGLVGRVASLADEPHHGLRSTAKPVPKHARAIAQVGVVVESVRGHAASRRERAPHSFPHRSARVSIGEMTSPRPVPSIRLADEHDVASLVEANLALARESEGKTLDRAVVERGVRGLLERPHAGFYLIAGGTAAPAGSLLVTPEWSDWRDGWFWWIQSVYVAPSWRGCGVYRALHEEVARRARAADGVRGLRLYVERENAAARAVYERIGMSETTYRLYEVPLDRPG